MRPASCARAFLAALCAALACASSSPVFSIGKHGGGHRHGHARRGGGHQAAAYSGMHSLAPTTKNIGVSEKNIDGHVDDLVWVGKDSETMFLVRARSRACARGGGGGGGGAAAARARHVPRMPLPTAPARPRRAAPRS